MIWTMHKKHLLIRFYNRCGRPIGLSRTGLRGAKEKRQDRLRSDAHAHHHTHLRRQLCRGLLTLNPSHISHFMSLLGVKRTGRFALHESAFDPKRTLMWAGLNSFERC